MFTRWAVASNHGADRACQVPIEPDGLTADSVIYATSFQSDVVADFRTKGRFKRPFLSIRPDCPLIAVRIVKMEPATTWERKNRIGNCAARGFNFLLAGF